jgi:hypothetical protein
MGMGRETIKKGCKLPLDNFEMSFREIGCEGVDWIHLAQSSDQWSALVNTAMNIRVS